MWKFVLLILQALPSMENLAHSLASPLPSCPSLSLSQLFLHLIYLLHQIQRLRETVNVCQQKYRL